jgi:hypothetical protein
MGAKRGRDERQRCSECGGKYEPRASAREHQRTCGEGCRRRRRARQARDRYQAAGLASRDGERERKQEWRNERQKGPGSQRPGLPPEVKRAIAREMDGLSSEGRQQRRGVERALRRVAKRACAGQMSLAGLGADPLMISEG